MVGAPESRRDAISLATGPGCPSGVPEGRDKGRIPYQGLFTFLINTVIKLSTVSKVISSLAKARRVSLKMKSS